MEFFRLTVLLRDCELLDEWHSLDFTTKDNAIAFMDKYHCKEAGKAMLLKVYGNIGDFRQHIGSTEKDPEALSFRARAKAVDF